MLGHRGSRPLSFHIRAGCDYGEDNQGHDPIDGNPRPQGSAFDIGANQWLSGGCLHPLVDLSRTEEHRGVRGLFASLSATRCRWVCERRRRPPRRLLALVGPPAEAAARASAHHLAGKQDDESGTQGDDQIALAL